MAAIAVAAFAAGSATGAAPKVAGPRYLAFSSNRPGGQGAFDLYLYDRRGARLVPLPGANCPVDDAHPVLSRDSNLIAFTSARHPSKLRPGGVYLYDRRAARLVDLPGINGERCEGFTAMSGDGRFLGFTRFERTEAPPAGTLFPSSIQLYDRRATALVTPESLNPLGEAATSLCMSGNGRWLAGVRMKFAPDHFHLQGTLEVYDREEAAFVKAPPVPGSDPAPDRGMPSLSGDGRWLAVTTRPSPTATWDIAVYDRKRGEYLETPGLNSPESEEFPSLSRDGRFLACETRHGADIDLVLYDLRERRLVLLPGLNSEAKDRHPALSQE